MAPALLGSSGIDMATSLRTIKTPKGGASMTSTTATFNDFEAQTIEARVYLQRVRRSMEGTKIHLGIMWYGTCLLAALSSVVEDFRAESASGKLDAMPDAEYKEMAHLLEKLYFSLQAILDRAHRNGLDATRLHRRTFRRIRKQTTTIGDILETIRLGLNPKFNALVEEAVHSLE